MREAKDIVCENLVALRKQFKMTQMELGNQVGYSDKAISRWEKGEVIPDIPTLERLAKLYQIPIAYFFEEHKSYERNRAIFNNVLLVEFLAIFVVWTIIAVLYAITTLVPGRSGEIVGKWQLFIAGVPLTCIVMSIFNKRFHHNGTIYLIIRTIAIWTTITFIYCVFLKSNFWQLYLIGVPLQAITIALFVLLKRTSN